MGGEQEITWLTLNTVSGCSLSYTINLLKMLRQLNKGNTNVEKSYCNWIFQNSRPRHDVFIIVYIRECSIK